MSFHQIGSSNLSLFPKSVWKFNSKQIKFQNRLEFLRAVHVVEKENGGGANKALDACSIICGCGFV